MKATTGTTRGRSRLVLIDDHAVFREGMRALLAPESDLEVIGEAANAREATLLLEHEPVDLALVDLKLPGASGISIIQEVRRLQPKCRVLVLSMVEEPYRIAETFQAGASGYALKSQPMAEILAAIRAAVLGGIRYLPPRIARREIDELARRQASGPFGLLSRREREVLDLVIRGHSNVSVASELFIALRTVETHRQHIMAKVGVRSGVDLVRLAAIHGLLGD